MNKKCYMPPCPPPMGPALVTEDEMKVIIGRLWDKINAKFSEKSDVLAVAKELKKLSEMPVTRAVESGANGPMFAVGSDNVAHIRYENWVEGDVTDANGVVHHSYNDSQNALTASAAAMVIKNIRAEFSKHQDFSVYVTNTIDSDTGEPIVPTINFQTLYLAPSKDAVVGNNWIEWIAVKDMTIKNGYRWERVGADAPDLSWLTTNVNALNESIKTLEKQIDGYTKDLQDAIINKAEKPLKELKDYMTSDEFIQDLMKRLPRASITSDGLMSANSFALLSWLSIWANNDHKITGGGALSADFVKDLFEENNIEADDLDAFMQP